LRIGPAYEAGLSAGMRIERVPPRRRKKERKKESLESFKDTEMYTDDITKLTAAPKSSDNVWQRNQI